MSVNLGNVIQAGRHASGQWINDLHPGFRGFVYQGTARITTTPANNWAIADDGDQPPTFAASAADPIWIFHTSFRVPRALTGTNGDVLKLGVSAADAAGYIVNSSAVAGGSLGVQQAVLAIAPAAPVQVTANLTLGLFLHNGVNAAPGGTLVLPAGAPNFVRIPVRVVYVRRGLAPTIEDCTLSTAQQRLDAGVV
jgi:hypothetical protein